MANDRRIVPIGEFGPQGVQGNSGVRIIRPTEQQSSLVPVGRREVYPVRDGRWPVASLEQATGALDKAVLAPEKLTLEESVTRGALESLMGGFGRVVGNAAINMSRRELDRARQELGSGHRVVTEEEVKQYAVQNLNRDRLRTNGTRLKVFFVSMLNPAAGGHLAGRAFRERQQEIRERPRLAGEQPRNLRETLEVVDNMTGGNLSNGRRTRDVSRTPLLPEPRQNQGQQNEKRGFFASLADILGI